MPNFTLIVHGDADDVVQYPYSVTMADRIPNAQLYAFEGRGHLPIFTATREFCDVLRHFMQERMAPRRARA